MVRKTSYSEDCNFNQMLSENIIIDFDAGIVLKYIADNFEPEDVFDAEVLANWALDNGYEEKE